MSTVYIHKPEVHNTNASSVVVPLLIRFFKPVSVLDVGCGTGTWLKSFLDNGVTDVIGIDGDFVSRELLKENITDERFKPMDLSYPFDLKRSFDLVISLEVAEHLPESSAKGFVESLVNHGKTIVFSAAIPGQGGQNHINEQWKKYWIELFNGFGYKPYDIIRPLIWDDAKVDWWYKQNMLVFSTDDLSDNIKTKSGVMEIIHPDLLRQNQDYIVYLQEYVKELEIKLYAEGH